MLRASISAPPPLPKPNVLHNKMQRALGFGEGKGKRYHDIHLNRTFHQLTTAPDTKHECKGWSMATTARKGAECIERNPVPDKGVRIWTSDGQLWLTRMPGEGTYDCEMSRGSIPTKTKAQKKAHQAEREAKKHEREAKMDNGDDNGGDIKATESVRPLFLVSTLRRTTPSSSRSRRSSLGSSLTLYPSNSQVGVESAARTGDDKTVEGAEDVNAVRRSFLARARVSSARRPSEPSELTPSRRPPSFPLVLVLLPSSSSFVAPCLGLPSSRLARSVLQPPFSGEFIQSLREWNICFGPGDEHDKDERHRGAQDNSPEQKAFLGDEKTGVDHYGAWHAQGHVGDHHSIIATKGSSKHSASGTHRANQPLLNMCLLLVFYLLRVLQTVLFTQDVVVKEGLIGSDLLLESLLVRRRVSLPRSCSCTERHADAAHLLPPAASRADAVHGPRRHLPRRDAAAPRQLRLAFRGVQHGGLRRLHRRWAVPARARRRHPLPTGRRRHVLLAGDLARRATLRRCVHVLYRVSCSLSACTKVGRLADASFILVDRRAQDDVTPSSFSATTAC